MTTPQQSHGDTVMTQLPLTEIILLATAYQALQTEYDRIQAEMASILSRLRNLVIPWIMAHEKKPQALDWISDPAMTGPLGWVLPPEVLADFRQRVQITEEERT